MIGNNQPGMGLGLTASRLIAHGLGTTIILIVLLGKAIYVFEYKL